MKAAGLHAGLDAGYAGRVEPPPYEPGRDPETLLLNPHGLRAYARRLAEAVSGVLREGKVPVVLGGDCSNLIGCTLALRRAGRYGLFFIDGHADFYQPEAEPNGEVASMDLAIVSGRGPRVLTDIDGLGPLARDEDIVALPTAMPQIRGNTAARISAPPRSTPSLSSGCARWGWLRPRRRHSRRSG